MTRALAKAIVAVARIEARYAQAMVPHHALTDYSAWRLAHNAANEMALSALKEHGAAVRVGWQETSVRLSGIRSASTGGIHGAMLNWLRAARKKLATPAA